MAEDISTTLAQLVDAEPALRKVSEQDGLSAKVKYAVAKLARLVSEETKHWYTERAALFEGLGVEREARTPAERAQHGPTVREIPPDQIATFQTRIKELGAIEVTIPWGPIRSVDLPSAKASDLVDLGPLVELVEPPETGATA